MLVIRSADIERSAHFYETLGLHFSKHAHGHGSEHYAAESNGFVFEIYPRRKHYDEAIQIRFGFRVDDVDTIVEQLLELEVTVCQEPHDSPWGRRTVVKDFDGYTIELIAAYAH
ncbi:VOC family protein [Vacuolonema iberomarrocanum]|uniref:VOC family protein n=1 Tax=Vacuolonema iberomarrocanum TaxID=3454632 RepID=UPI003F6DFBDC